MLMPSPTPPSPDQSPSSIDYDLLVIGAGAVGENVADRAVQGGLTVAIIEAELVGGECSYWACMPSKALLRSAAALDAARKVGGAKQAVTGDIDVAAVLKRRNSFTSNWVDDSQADWVASAGIDLIRGKARFTGSHRIAVTSSDGSVTNYTGAAVAVATGSHAILPDITGLVDAAPWTSREATSVAEIPGRFVIIGGGVVACEMATAYAGLGSQVTLIARGGLLAGNEPFAGNLVAESLRGMGVELLLNTSPTAVQRRDAGEVVVSVPGRDVEADELLVATGRSAGTIDLGLDTIGLVDGDWLDVDDTMRVTGQRGSTSDAHSLEWLYAVGDVNHRVLLTHQGKYQARAAGDAIAARAKSGIESGGSADNRDDVSTQPWSRYVATADHEAVPQVTFTSPEVASVGLTLAAAQAAGYRVRAVDYEIGNVAGASVHRDHFAGTARLVVDEDRKVVVGATFVGPDVAELLHAATIAVVAQVPLDRLWHAVPAYPTINEVWLRLLETYGRDSA
jgi:pyruvate/2-oxoglutarate dehydrogenase complex dihydrolipoamide dehydrogenase (E3) component